MIATLQDEFRVGTPPREQLELFFSLLRRIAGAGGLSPDDVNDFVQSTCVRLLETDYAVFRRFEGNSSLRTYLTVVAGRLLADWKNQAWGKWRPSAAAIRLGAPAVAVERLVSRDGLTIEEAVQTLRGRSGNLATTDLRRLASALPARRPRRHVSIEVLADMPAAGDDDPVLARERAAKARRRLEAVQALLGQLPPEDRRLIEARYLEQKKVPVVAHDLGHDAKQVYRRCERLLLRLRHGLDELGLGRTVALEEWSHAPR